jgi:hypothetical protein
MAVQKTRVWEMTTVVVVAKNKNTGETEEFPVQVTTSFRDEMIVFMELQYHFANGYVNRKRPNYQYLSVKL